MTRGTIKPVEFEAIQFVGTGDAAFERIEEIHDWLRDREVYASISCEYRLDLISWVPNKPEGKEVPVRRRSMLDVTYTDEFLERQLIHQTDWIVYYPHGRQLDNRYSVRVQIVDDEIFKAMIDG